MIKGVLVLLALCGSIATAQDKPRVFIKSAEIADGGNSKDKAKHVDFGVALAAAIMKKDVPVMLVTDSSKAQWTITSTSTQKEAGSATKIAKFAMGDFSSNSHFEGTIQVVDNASSGVIYAYNIKKDDFQSAAEAFAKHFKGDYLEKKK